MRPITGDAASSRSPIHVLEHPLAAVMVTRLRDKATPPPAFRQWVSCLAGLLAYEATRNLALVQRTVETPLMPTTGSKLAKPIVVIPILRAGLGMSDGVLNLIPQAQVGHLGMARNEATLEPMSYYEKYPPCAKDACVLMVDPMLATGGSSIAAAERLLEHGFTDVRFLSLIASPEGVERFTTALPQIPIYTACLDERLNDQGYILPGLGDAGDRLFGTYDV